MRVEARYAALGWLLALAGCATLAPPIVQTQLFVATPGPPGKIAVVPFAPEPGLARDAQPQALLSAAASAELVTRFVAEALARRGSAVVAPNDLVIAFEAAGLPLPRGDAKAVAEMAAQQFGATAVMLGRVQRYREREGSSTGSLRPASVAFDLELYAAPSGEKLYMAHFDHTQAALTSDLFGALRYPGSGTRWLSAADLARWGADHATEAIPGEPQ